MDIAAIAMDALLAYGLLAVFILIFLDGALLMPGFPGELVLIIYITIFQPDFATLILLGGIGVAATLLSAIPLYYIGRGAASKMAKRKKRLFGMSPKMQERMQRLFASPLGGVLLVFARLFLPTRAIVSVPAGIARMPFMRFMVLSLIGTVIFFIGYIWLIFEFQNPDSAIAQTGTAIDQAYMSPAWTLVQANWIVAIVALIVLGIVLSVRASKRMAREAHETSGSIIGFIVRTGLFWGGAALLVAIWINNVAVYEGLAAIGIEAEALTLGLPGEPDTLIAAVAVVSILTAMMLNSIRRSAREKNRILQIEEEKQQRQMRMQDQFSRQRYAEEKEGRGTLLYSESAQPRLKRLAEENTMEFTRADHEETLRGGADNDQGSRDERRADDRRRPSSNP